MNERDKPDYEHGDRFIKCLGRGIKEYLPTIAKWALVGGTFGCFVVGVMEIGAMINAPYIDLIRQNPHLYNPLVDRYSQIIFITDHPVETITGTAAIGAVMGAILQNSTS